MAITFLEKERQIVLETKHTSYHIYIGDYGVLQHLYYGPKVGLTDLSHLIRMRDLGFAGQVPEAGNRREFSVDTLLQEYPSYGVGDYRSEALRMVDEQGGYGADLRYVRHQIYQGKYRLDGLPAVYAEPDQADTLEITLKDVVHDVFITLYYGVLPELDIITRAVRIENQSNQTITLEKAASACLEFYDCNYQMLHFYGRHAMERESERTPLHHGIQSIGSIRGASGHQHNPFLILADPQATETAGACYGMTLVYSGNFLAEAEVDQLNQVRLIMGIHPTQFRYQLTAGESFIAPEVVMSCSDSGFGQLSEQFHRSIRYHLCRGPLKLKRRPVLINNWEATYFDFNEKDLCEIAGLAGQLGVEMFVLDDGWFGKRNGPISGLGDWFVNEQKIKGGLGALSEYIHELGMQFGMWFEPEMVSEDSELYRSHPEWCLAIPGRKPGRSRFQLVLDMSRGDVVNYLYCKMCEILDSARIEYIKWDMNRSLADVWSAKLPAGRQGEVHHRYVLGVYELLERLLKRYPDLLIEGCSGGGGRFDAGMLYYTPQIWCSDNTDAIDRVFIQYGTSFGYPISAVGSHVSAVPNHQTGRTTPFHTRGVIAMAGSFGYELDIRQLTSEEKTDIKEQIRLYKKYQPLIHNGRYERLSNPYEQTDYAAWQFVAADRSEALFIYVVLKSHANPIPPYLRLRGLEPAALYRIEGQDKEYTGAALMYAGLPMSIDQEEYEAQCFYLQKRT